MIRKSFPATTKALDEDQGIVEAIVNCTGLIDLQKDLMEPGAWDGVIKSAQMGDSEWPSLVWGHDWSVTTGKVLAAEELRPGDGRLKGMKGGKATAGGLRIVAQYNLETQRGREAFSDVKFGAVKQWSVGFLSADDGEHFDNKGIRHVTKVGVWPEVSNVLIGASPGTYTSIVKALDPAKDRGQRSGNRIAQAQAIFEHVIITKDMPALTGDEAVHNKPLNDAFVALKTLIQQELAEDEVEFDCVNRLSAIALQLQGWAQDEATEYSDYTSMTAPMAEVIQAGIKVLATTKEVAVAEAETPVDEPVAPAKADTSPEVTVPEPEPETEGAFDINNPSTWTPEFYLAVQAVYRELVSPPQHSDPDNSGVAILTNFGRQNTRTGEEPVH